MVAFELFGLEIYWYGIFYLVAFLIWYLFFYLVAKKKYFKEFKNLQNLLEKWIDDLVIAIALGVILWWRLWYVLIYDFWYFLANPMDIFTIWQWGMGFIWGVIWVIMAMLFIKKIYKLNLTEFLLLIDMIVIVLPFGIMLWRIWNFLNQELYGMPVNILDNSIIEWILSSLGLVYVYDQVDTILRINTNFLESFFEWFLILLVLIWLFYSKYITVKNKIKLNPWLLSGVFLLLYWISRFFLEFLRDHPVTDYLWYFTKTQFFMIFFVVWWIYLIIRKK